MDAYALLGCSSTDSDHAIRGAFLKAALQTHPDKASTANKQAAAESFKQLGSAYEGVMQARKKLAKTAEALSPATAFRELYGEPGTQSSFAHSSLNSSFAHVTSSFGPSSSAPRPGSIGLDSRTSSGGLSSGLSSMASASTFAQRLVSPQASIAGAESCSTATTATVPSLAGAKRAATIAASQQARQVEQVLTLTLEELYCGCTKRMLLQRRGCEGASGSGRPAQEVLEVAVAPGWKEGTRVTFRGKGDSLPGCPPADLVFIVREELHPRYERRNNDLITRVSIPLVTALTGGNVQLTSLDQRTISLPILDVVTPYCERIVQGEGMPIPRSPGLRGNLIVKFDLEFPRTLSPLQKCLLRTAFQEPGPCHASPTHAAVADASDDCSAASTICSDVLDENMAGTAVAAARAIIMSVLQGSIRSDMLRPPSLRLLTG